MSLVRMGVFAWKGGSLGSGGWGQVHKNVRRPHYTVTITQCERTSGITAIFFTFFHASLISSGVTAAMAAKFPFE